MNSKNTHGANYNKKVKIISDYLVLEEADYLLIQFQVFKNVFEINGGLLHTTYMTWRIIYFVLSTLRKNLSYGSLL